MTKEQLDSALEALDTIRHYAQDGMKMCEKVISEGQRPTFHKGCKETYWDIICYIDDMKECWDKEPQDLEAA